MTDISEDAYVLLKTARKRALKTWGGKVFDNARIAAWYNEDEDDENWASSTRSLLTELIAAKLIDYEDTDDTSDDYHITPKGEDYIRRAPSSPSIIQSFSNINGSNIANMSSHTHQALDLSSYSTEIRQEVVELKEAIAKKDTSRVKQIIDGLWVSAPALVLQLLQIGLSVEAGSN